MDDRWTALAKDFARCTDEAAWQAASRASLASLVAFARTPPWFLWEDAFDR